MVLGHLPQDFVLAPQGHTFGLILLSDHLLGDGGAVFA
jgi:hypothetical protein